MRTSARSSDFADKLLSASEQQGLIAASISVRLVWGMRRLIGCTLTFLVLFVGHVMADGASTDRTEDAMVPGVMARHTTDQRALETAFRFG